MANLYSSKNRSVLTINVIGYENIFEDWLFVELVFISNGKIILKTNGVFVRENELLVFRNDIQKIIDCKIEEVESVFLEPNLNIKIEKLKNNQFQANAIFLESINYANGKINRENGKNLVFETNKENLVSFMDELMVEIVKIKKI
jgi:hypothetical protein